MNKEEIIEAIYEKIADKTLSFGCWCIVEKFVSKRQICSMVYQDDKNDMNYFYTKEKWNVYIEDIIWHPVMIWDVLYYIEQNAWNNKWLVNIWWLDEIYRDYDWMLFDLWEDKRKSIENQSKKCIEWVYNLIK